jgi:GntR family transcriptional regulator, galactonate operon transcriptional repressor
MRLTLERMRAAQEVGDSMAFSRADIDFHAAVLNSVENYFVAALLAPVDAGLREIRTQTSQERRMNERAVVMHEKIYQAIRRRSARAAAELMSRHLNETKKYIEGLSRQSDEDTTSVHADS